MRITTKLLRQFADLPSNNEEIVHLIKEHIGEVDYHHNLEDDYRDIVIAEIVEKKDHPDADKLAIYQINYGEKENIQVVAGDKKLEVGNKVAYLKVGSKVPYSIHTDVKPFVLSQVKLRGVVSNGMLGSEKELNIGTDHENVLVLNNEAPVGESFSKYYELDDYVIDIENKALTNRGDLFGVLGIARELSAIVGNRFESPDWYLEDKNNLKPEDSCLKIEIINDAEALCPRYVAVALDNVSVKESPIWLKSCLIKCGFKPVNNIVDITNYISLIIGQPLHAFDYDKLIKQDPSDSNKALIKVRMAKHGEKILGLDEKIYELDEKTMVIADSTHPIAIAGIIGGKDSEVDESTQRIILESANFDKSSIRRTSMRLGIFTEAATRFKHNIDPEQCLPGLLKAVKLIQEATDSKISSEVVDIYNMKPESKTIQIHEDSVNLVLGTDIDRKDIKKLLENLEYTVKNKDSLYITPPSWRKDIDIKEDIYEDIGRIYGFNNIDHILPKKEIKPPRTNKLINTKRLVREALSNNGVNETVNYSFVSSELFKKANLDKDLAYRIQNAISPELSLMRTCILPSLLQKGRENLERGFNRFSLYEIALPHLNNYISDDKLPVEKWHLSMLSLSSSNGSTDGSPYYLAKRYLEEVFKKLNISKVKYELIADSTELDLPLHVKNCINMFEPNSTAVVSVQGVILGLVGEIKNSIKDSFKLPDYTCAFEIGLEELSNLKIEQNKYVEQSIYPSFRQDLCFELNRETQYIEVKDSIEKIINTDVLCGSIVCIDIYGGEKVDESKKRITVRITVSHYEKTLDEKDTEEIINNIQKEMEKKLDAILV